MPYLPPALWDGYLVVVPVMAVLLGYRVLRLLTDRGTAVLLSLTQFVCWLFLEMAATGSDMVVIGWLFALATTASTLGLRRHDAALTSVGDAAYRLFATSRLPLLVVTAASGVVLLVVSGARAWRVVAYWSQEMRREVERVRATGTNLVFLGANTMYWRVRLEQGGRVVVGYRTDAALDPAPGSMRTGLWREAVEADPENGLTGMEYECFPVDAPFRVSSPDWWGFAGTGVHRGEELDHLVGVEADRVYPVRGTPRPLQVLAHASYSCRGVPTSTQAVYYTTPSGAAVLNVGTLRWTCALVDRCPVPLTRRTVRFVNRVTATVLRDFSRGPAARRHPAHDNVGHFDLPTQNLVPAS